MRIQGLVKFIGLKLAKIAGEAQPAAEPVAPVTAPVQDQGAPVQTTPAPVESAPVQDTPAPVETAPLETAPAPAPQPVQAPAPVVEDAISFDVPEGFIGVFTDTSLINTTLSATPPRGEMIVSYQIVSGAMPSGLVLDPGTGNLSGEMNGIVDDGDFSFVLRAVASTGGYKDATYSLTIKPE